MKNRVTQLDIRVLKMMLTGFLKSIINLPDLKPFESNNKEQKFEFSNTVLGNNKKDWIAARLTVIIHRKERKL